MTATSQTPAALFEQLTHPYPRYGLAVAAYLQKWQPDTELEEADLRDTLIFAIEDGMGHFRMRTTDDPQHSTELHFAPIRRLDLLNDANLIQSAGLAAKGMYLYPSVVSIDGGAKDTFKNAVAVVDAIRSGKDLASSLELSRSFAPTTAKINGGTASQTPPKGTLLDAACAIIATLTPIKPAVWPGEANTVIIPDLPLVELRDFISLFAQMALSETRELMTAKLPVRILSAADGTASKTSKPKKITTTSEYRRPRLHAGNYPFAPLNADAFGAVGLLGAIGRWAHRAKETTWAARVLYSLVGAPLYLISYDQIRQVRFGHHVARLAADNQVSNLIATLYRDTVLYRDTEVQRRYDNPTYQLFYFTAARFLQLFNPPAFADFLAQRAEYAAELQPLLNEYFMSAQNISSEIVQSVKALGRWLNNTAYRMADEETDAGAQNRAELVKKAKAKILVEFESAALSAKTPDDLLFRISTRAGRLLNSDAPAAADLFMDATALGEDNGGISQKTATHLLIAYMRLRGKNKQQPATKVGAGAEASAIETLTEAQPAQSPMIDN
jgi:hypothetical protein